MGSHLQLVKPNEPKAKKRFGQHFLRDKGVIGRIVRWINPGPADFFMEIGAGSGALSAELAPHVSRLLAVEVDSDCIPALNQTLAPYKSAIVIEADFLQVNLSELLSRYAQPDQKVRIAGNLPYNIATAIIDILMHSDLLIEDMRFMLQLEVAQRITAIPGSREFGYLSVNCQHHCEVRIGFKVPPNCFSPRPQVSSAMVSFQPKHLHQKDEKYEQGFEALAKASFSYRRKKLVNSLGRHAVFGEFAEELLMRAGIDRSRRAEELSVQEYEDLAQIYLKHFA
jgi:16S rRNA (adenine1518-N6/adenine1519-N6)-dimethyltransferase